MFLHIGFLGKRAATDNALERFLSCVAPYMLLKVKVFGEEFVTEITLELWTSSF